MMKLLADTHGTVQLKIRDDKSDIEVEMNYDDQLEHYEIAVRDGEGTVTPQPPLKRIPGEEDEVYFDRCCITAHRHFLTFVEERVLEQSRFEQQQMLLGKIEDCLSHMQQTVARWDNDKPTDAELRDLRERLDSLGFNQDQLSALS